MFDTNCTDPFEAMIATLRERRADMEVEERVIRGRIAEIDEMIMVMASRKPRVKKPRVTGATEKVICASGETDEAPPRPTVFAIPSGESGESAEAA